MPVALGQPLGRALVGGGADHAGELGFDQGLVDRLGGLADAVVDLRRRECVQDFDECRLVKGHRALCPFARTIAVVSLTIARWPLRGEQLPHQGPATYTTQWDATIIRALALRAILNPMA
jgi:ClpP class serine protease